MQASTASKCPCQKTAEEWTQSKYLSALTQHMEVSYAQERDEECAKVVAEQAELRRLQEESFAKELETMEKQLQEQQAAIAEAEAMHARRRSDGEQFTYIIRGCKDALASGSIPRKTFDAEPESALAKMYNGNWEHATDDQGRAVINSNPAHWPLILDWLSFGAVPKAPSDAFIQECTYWQLDRLLAAMDLQNSEDDPPACPRDTYLTAVEGSHHLEIRRCTVLTAFGGHVGFVAEGHIEDFAARLAKAGNGSLGCNLQLSFSAAGRKWKLQMNQQSWHLAMVEGASIQLRWMKCNLGSAESIMEFLGPKEKLLLSSSSGPVFGAWSLDHLAAAQLMHPSMLKADGSIGITLALCFCYCGSRCNGCTAPGSRALVMSPGRQLGDII